MNSDEPRRLMTEFAEQYPDPLNLLARAYGRTVRAAINCGIDRDDLRGLCWLGVAKAAHKFRPDAGAKFSTYAVYGMWAEVSQEVRRSTGKHIRPFVLSSVGPADDSDFADTIPAPDQWAEHDRNVSAAEISSAAQRLLPHGLCVSVLSVIGLAESVNEDVLCKRMKVSPETLRQVKKRSLLAVGRAVGVVTASGVATG